MITSSGERQALLCGHKHIQGSNKPGKPWSKVNFTVCFCFLFLLQGFCEPLIVNFQGNRDGRSKMFNVSFTINLLSNRQGCVMTFMGPVLHKQIFNDYIL